MKDNLGIREKVHIVLRGPDGKVKDERLQGKRIKAEVHDGRNKRPGVSK